MVDEMATTADEEFSQAAQSYIRAVGARLRVVRNQLGLSLQAVEATSSQEFKASVLGAYERGERAVSVSRLQRLAKLYGVSVDQLLPNESDATRWWMSKDAEAPGTPAPEPRRSAAVAEQRHGDDRPGTLRDVSGPERDLIRRFVSMIQVQRQDFNGQLITIRSSDVRAIACLFGMTPDAMGRRLDELRLRINT